MVANACSKCNQASEKPLVFDNETTLYYCENCWEKEAPRNNPRTMVLMAPSNYEFSEVATTSAFSEAPTTYAFAEVGGPRIQVEGPRFATYRSEVRGSPRVLRSFRSQASTPSHSEASPRSQPASPRAPRSQPASPRAEENFPEVVGNLHAYDDSSSSF